MVPDADLPYKSCTRWSQTLTQLLIMINNKWNKESRLGLVISFGPIGNKIRQRHPTCG